MAMAMALALVVSAAIAYNPIAQTVKAESTGVLSTDFQANWTLTNATASTAYSKSNLRITQQNVLEVTKEASTQNQVATAEYNYPLYIAKNGKDTPFITYSIDPQGWGQRDMDAIIFTLYDENDPTQYVSVMQLFAAPNVANSSLFYAKGTGQVYQGYHSSGDVYSAGKLLGLNQGTISEAALYQDNESNSTKTVSQFINLYYDNETKAVYTDYYWADYDSRTIPNATNASGAKLVMIRDLDDEAYLNGDKAYAPDIKTAKLKITTVRGWYDYTDEFGEKNTSNIYSNQFYGGSADTHTLTKAGGARYLIRGLNGQATDVTSGNIVNNNIVSPAINNVKGAGHTVKLPTMYNYNVLNGKTAYTGDLYVKAEGAELTGLNEGKWTADATATWTEVGTKTIKYYSDVEMTTFVDSCTVEVGHEYDNEYDEICNGCGTFKDGIGSMAGVSVSTTGNVALNFYMLLATDTAQDTGAYLSVVKGGEEVKRIPVSEANLKEGYYVFSYEVTAKEMDEVITVKIVLTNGEQGTEYTQSIAQYAKVILEDTNGQYSEAVKSVVAAMINYGKYAKAYFNDTELDSDANTTAIEAVTAEMLQKYEWTMTGEDENVTVLGYTLVLESETSIRIYYTVKAGAATPTVSGGKVKTKGEVDTLVYYVEISDISAADLDTDYTVMVGGYSFTICALDYAGQIAGTSNTKLVNLVKALYLYNAAVNNLG